MGEVVGYKCEKCGYRFDAYLGMCFGFLRIYNETVAKMKNGKLGEEAKQFFDEHPDGAINCDRVIMHCEKCGEYDSRKAMTMYVPKDGHVMSYSIPSWDLWAGRYTRYADYPHKCEYCGGDMRIVAGDEPIVCPHCGEEMAKSLVGFWD